MTPKSGFLTSEFWITAIPTIIAMWGSMKGFIPQPYATYVEIGVPAIYAISRTALKAVQMIRATTQPTVVVATPAA